MNETDETPETQRPEGAYTVFTPSGVVYLVFPEDGGCDVTGDAPAIEHLELALAANTGIDGRSLSVAALEPIELESAFDAQAWGMAVFPPIEELKELLVLGAQERD